MSVRVRAERKIARPSPGSWLVALLVVLFFFSGLSGLIYQVLWLRLLGLVFGVTVYAASTVLASFMTGLALGSYSAGKFVDRAKNPLFWFGALEVSIGILALLTPIALKGVEQLYVSLYAAMPAAPELIVVVRFVLAFIVLVAPTTLMGASLPIIIKSSLLRAEGLGERVSLLYATNTAGAIAGTLLAGFYLIGSLGMQAAFEIAATFNVGVGLIAMLASRAFNPARQSAGETDAAKTESRSAEQYSDRARKVVLFVFALSGFVSLGLEVVWFRVLVLLLPATTYAFTIMLATVLFGLAAGSYLVAPLMRFKWNWLYVLALAELAIGILAILSVALMAQTYDLLPAVKPNLPALFQGDLGLSVVASLLAILPATLLLGAAFPIGMRIWASGGDAAHTGERVGVFYSLNVFGAILGALSVGFILLPTFGSQASFLFLSALALIAGLALLLLMPRPRRAFSFATGIAAILIFAASAAAQPNPFSVALAHRYPNEKLLWQEEGAQTTVSIHERENGIRVMYLDGLHQANDGAGMVSYHRLIGHLAMAIHNNPRDVLIVGLGGGATPGAASRYGGAKMDIIELSSTVVRGAYGFAHVNYDVIRRPNVNLRIDDGRNYMLLTPKRYDVMTADVIEPFHAGAGNLYSAEYFRLVRNVLKDDGLMVQWIGQGTETEYKLLMRTFLSVFPNATLWANGSLLVGTKQPLGLDSVAFAQKLRDPETRDALESIGIFDFDHLLSYFTAGPNEMKKYVGAGDILTDDRPIIEYFLSLPANDKPVDITGLHSEVWNFVKR